MVIHPAAEAAVLTPEHQCPVQPPPYKLKLALVIVAVVVSRTVMAQHVSIDSLAALGLTGDTTVSTFPATCMEIGSMLATVPASRLMARCGRRVGFLVGALFLGLGSTLSAIALQTGSFALLLCGVSLAGVGEGVSEFLRFVAADLAPKNRKARAVSLTIGASVVSGIAGGQIAKLTAHATDLEFQGSYVANVVLAAIYFLIILVTPQLGKDPTRDDLGCDPPEADLAVHRNAGHGASEDGGDHRSVSPWKMYRTHLALVVATLCMAAASECHHHLKKNPGSLVQSESRASSNH